MQPVSLLIINFNRRNVRENYKLKFLYENIVNIADHSEKINSSLNVRELYLRGSLYWKGEERRGKEKG